MFAIKTPERRHWHLSGVLIVNFEHSSHLVLAFSLLALKMQLLARINKYIGKMQMRIQNPVKHVR